MPGSNIEPSGTGAAAAARGTISASRPRAGRAGRLLRRPETGAFIGLVLVYSFFAIAAAGKGLVSVDGSASILNVTAELGIIAIPLSLLMIAGEFDLSVGAVMGTSSLIVAFAHGYLGVPLAICVPIALAMGLLVGFINGLITTRTGLPSFIVTLASYLVIAGASLGISRLLVGVSVASFKPEGFVRDLFAGRPADTLFNISIAWWIGVAILAHVVLSRFNVGNWIYATGGDLESARTAGVPIQRVKIALFMATSVGAALVGVIQAMEFQSGDATRGQSFVFNSIIACVIGGVLLKGGYGSVIGVVFGTITYGVVSVSIFYTGWNPDWGQLLLGLLMLAAVLANNFFQRLAMRAR